MHWFDPNPELHTYPLRVEPKAGHDPKRHGMHDDTDVPPVVEYVPAGHKKPCDTSYVTPDTVILTSGQYDPAGHGIDVTDPGPELHIYTSLTLEAAHDPGVLTK
jgi:hypothetical protein